MDLKQLQAMGGIVSKALTKKTVPVKRPILVENTDPRDPELTGEYVDDTLTIWIRKRSSADFLEMVRAPDRDKPFIAIRRCVCHEDGTEVFESVEQCRQLREWLFTALMMAVNEVNEFGLKNSKPRTSSGTSSPSSSAAPSRKLKRVSRKKNAPAGSPTAPSAAP